MMPSKEAVLERAHTLFMQRQAKHLDISQLPEESELKEEGYLDQARYELMCSEYTQDPQVVDSVLSDFADADKIQAENDKLRHEIAKLKDKPPETRTEVKTVVVERVVKQSQVVFGEPTVNVKAQCLQCRGKLPRGVLKESFNLPASSTWRFCSAECRKKWDADHAVRWEEIQKDLYKQRFIVKQTDTNTHKEVY